jgi:large repetitive protein
VIANFLWLNGGKKRAVKFAGKVAFNDKWDRSSEAAADFDGDGSIDIASTLDGVTIYDNDGNGTFTKRASYPVADSRNLLRAGDFNGDGKPDLAVGGKSIAILVNKGDGTFGSPVYYKFPESWDSASFMHVADLNGDSRSDVAIVDPYKGAAVYMNNGKGGLGTPIALAAGKAAQVAAGDFTGKHVMSLVVVDDNQSSDESTSNIYVLHGICR